MRRLSVLLCAVAISAVSHAQVYIGSGVTLGAGVQLAGAPAPTSPITFSPAAGVYNTSQAVTITGPAGTTCYYTLDGGLPTIASTPVSGPVAVSNSETLQAVCASVVKSYPNVQTSSSGWKCVTASGAPSGCQMGGGVVGTISAQSMTFGSPATFSASTTQPSSSSAENQILWPHTSTGCGGSCTVMAEDKIFATSQGSGYIANNELDMIINDPAHSRLHGGGLQCNQQAGKLQWQIDNQQGSWQNTGFTLGCPITAGQYIEARYQMHWTNGDTGCGGWGCDTYDFLTVCTGSMSGSTFIPSTCQNHPINTTLEADTDPGWGDDLIIQDQIDLTNTTQSGANPTTAARTLVQDNLAAGIYSTQVNAAAAYTINYPVTPPSGATALTNLEQTGSWAGDSTFSVSGAYAPAVCAIVPGGGNPCPGAGTSAGGTYTGAGGGSTMELDTTGEPGKYTGWMARKAITTSGQLNMLLRSTYTFSSVTGIQAWEMGRRSTNAAQVTDNGQTELVPIGGGMMRLDYVPNGSGAAWTDTGCRFPMFTAGTPNTEEIYYVNDTNGAVSIKYVLLNNTVCTLSPSLQHQSGVVQSPAWAANSSVIGVQPDDNTSGAAFNATGFTMSVYLW